jgi:hypothetical protein
MVDLPKKIVLKLIRVYQKTLSLDHGFFAHFYSEGWCRFRPTCSEYTFCAIEKYGLIKGGLLGFWRINRCNPWSRGGVDNIPTTEKQLQKLTLYGFITLLGYILFLFLLITVLSIIFK